MPNSPADYHLHTPLCHHAEGHPRLYAARALEIGLSEIGFADHNPFPEPFDDWRMAWEEFPRYFDMVEEARADFPELTIRLGLECDYLPAREDWLRAVAERADYDYLIGSVHYLDENWAIDDPRQTARWEALDIAAIWKTYFERLAAAAATGLYDILAHPDLVKKFGHIPPGDLTPYYAPAIAAIAEANAAIEINTAGLHKPIREMYPSRQFLELARQAEIPLVISSDSHHPDEVGRNFTQALQLSREVGYTQLARFQNRERTLHPLP